MLRNLRSEFYISSVKYVLVVIVAILVGCIPPPQSGTKSKLPTPYNLRVETVSKGATLFWSVNRNENDIISGYNIYIYDKSLKEEKKSIEPYNHAIYPGDIDGDKTKESFELTYLENSKRYYTIVKTVGINGDESMASNEVSFVPLAKGKFVISSDHSDENGGFSFDHEALVPARDLRCDMYLYAKKNVVGLSSPNRLSRGLRKSKFKMRESGKKKVDTIEINKNDEIVVSTKYGQAELRIVDVKHKDYNAKATIEYVFYPKGKKYY